MNMGTSIAHLVGNISRGQDRLSRRRADGRKAGVAREKAREAGQLDAEVGEIRLYLATLVSILIAKKYISADEFEEFSSIIDNLDGVADGRFDGEITPQGKVERGEAAEEDLKLRELAAAVQKMG